MKQTIDPVQTSKQIQTFLKSTMLSARKKRVVIAVSGGIDSAVALTLLVKSLGAEQITPVFLPYCDQDMNHAKLIVKWNQIDLSQVIELNINPPVEELVKLRRINRLSLTKLDAIRLGNMMSRTRMILIYDLAKKLNALVCGTENKSEHQLGYFTRFGDGASDVEPLRHLYKTQVRLLAKYLKLPAVFLDKPPSAGLWINQTDEQELGFSYEVADQVLEQLVDQHKRATQIKVPGVSQALVRKVISQVKNQEFKQQVPYVVGG